MTEIANGTQTTQATAVDACFFTNKTYFSLLMGGSSGEVGYRGSLRYEHLKFGKLINYTFDNRSLYTLHNSLISWCWFTNPWNFTLSPGTWYFIFTSDVCDLKQDDEITHISAWLNFSKECNDLTISTSEGGTAYALWFGEFDANVIRSKTWTSELMINGKTHFHINNTFIYWFLSYPQQSGYWNIRWDTPKGAMTFHALMTKNKWYFDMNKTGCVGGIAGSGEYMLRTGSFDHSQEQYEPAFMPYFIGLDVKLT
jgi:hypothetical protein